MNSNLFMANSFDPVAGIYDDTFSKTQIGKAQRDMVWKYLDKKKFVNKNILEINCGTGEDAIFLSKNNNLTATDASEEMLKITNEKIKLNEIGTRCKTLLWDLNDPFPGDRDEKYDLIFSNFGGLNCLSSETLKKLSAELFTLLRSGGKLIFVVMGRKCLWESFYFLYKGKFKSVFRRRKSGVVKAPLNDKIFVDTYYHSPREFMRFFDENFKLNKTSPVGFFIPPSYLDPFFTNKKRMLNLFTRLDQMVFKVEILSNYADHYLIELEMN